MLFPGKEEQLHLALDRMCYPWISTAFYCLPDTVNEHRALAYREPARAQQGGVFHLRFGFPLPFCQLACLTAMLLSSFAKEQETGHSQPSRNNPHRKTRVRLGWELLFLPLIPGNIKMAGCVWLCRAGVEVKNSDPSDTTQGEGQNYEVVFSRGMQGVEHKEMWWNREEAKLCTKLGEKRMASLKDSGNPGSYTGGTTHPFSGASEDWPSLQQVAQVGMAVMTLLAASSSVSLSPVLYPTSLILHRGGSAAVLSHEGKTVQKALQARFTLTGRDWAPFLLSQDPFFPPGWESSVWRQGIRKPAHPPGFQVPLVNNRRLFLSQTTSKAAELLSPVVPGAAVLVLPAEAEWGPEKHTHFYFPRRGKTLWEVTKSCNSSTGKLDMTVNKDVGCLFLKNTW